MLPTSNRVLRESVDGGWGGASQRASAAGSASPPGLEHDVQMLVTDIKTDKHGLGLVVSVKHRSMQWDRVLWCRWKWVAATDAIERIEAELARQGRSRERSGRPWLPLETWE